MTRFLPAVFAMVLLSSASRAEEAIVRLHVEPMAAPKPALKYRLLPELSELKPGNPAQEYIRCFAEQHYFFFTKQSAAERARYRSMPLAELRGQKMLDYGRSALRQADWAARLDTLDWQALARIQAEGIETSFPELGPLEVLGSALQVRFRAQVAEHRFDDAVRSAQTMLALARHLGEHPSVVGNLVGLSIAHQALGAVEEMIQEPRCPNLYWALTDLPSPLVDVRKGVEGDRASVTATLRLVKDDTAMSDADLDKLIGRLSGAMDFAREQEGRQPRNLRRALKHLTGDPDRVRFSRWSAVASGYPAGAVGAMPPAQVMLLLAKHEYEIERDERTKLLTLAPWQIDSQTVKETAEQGAEGLFGDLLPDVVGLRWQQARLEQRIAILRHVEAIRLYAVDHDSNLPDKLTDITLPLPLDPFTGKPFSYSKDRQTVSLCGGPFATGKNNGYNLRYEVSAGQYRKSPARTPTRDRIGGLR